MEMPECTAILLTLLSTVRVEIMPLLGLIRLAVVILSILPILHLTAVGHIGVLVVPDLAAPELLPATVVLFY
jgi:hypothetical protein